MIKKTKSSYISLLNHFWRLDLDHQFSPAETRVYFYLLQVSNSLEWQYSFKHSDKRSCASCGVSLAIFKQARAKLVEVGLIQYTPGGKGHAQKTSYTICDAPTQFQTFNTPQEQPKATPAPTPQEPQTPAPPLKKPIPASEKPKLEEPIIISDDELLKKVPQDNIERRPEAILQRLKDLKFTPVQLQQAFFASNCGQIGHPIWKHINEVVTSNGSIILPALYILKKINIQN